MIKYLPEVIKELPIGLLSIFEDLILNRDLEIAEQYLRNHGYSKVEIGTAEDFDLDCNPEDIVLRNFVKC